MEPAARSRELQGGLHNLCSQLPTVTASMASVLPVCCLLRVAHLACQEAHHAEEPHQQEHIEELGCRHLKLHHEKGYDCVQHHLHRNVDALH